MFDRPVEIKRTPVVIADLMWKPFDLRFQIVLEGIQFHQEIVRDELQHSETSALRILIQESGANSAFRDERSSERLLKLENSFDDQAKSKLPNQPVVELNIKLCHSELFLISVTRWIAGPEYKDRLHEALQERTEGTNDWIFDNETFQQWRRRPARDDNEEKADITAPSRSQFLWVSGRCRARQSRK